jgi:phenylacetate-CoA ligase
LHVNADAFNVRIADGDGRTLPPGESGEVVLSNLVNRPTVLLNYRLGDIAARLPEPCPCGRSLPLLSLLEGRSDDVLLNTAGEPVRAYGPRDALARLPGIWQYQIVQEELRRFTVFLVPAPSCDHEGVAQCIRPRLVDLCGGDVTADVRFVESIPATAAGKVRPIICKCRS